MKDLGRLRLPRGQPPLLPWRRTAGNLRHEDHLIAQAFSALSVSPGARAFYDQQRANGHYDALPRLANRLVGILHGCLKTRTL